MTGIVASIGFKALAGRALGAAASGAKSVAVAGRSLLSKLNGQGWAGLAVACLLLVLNFHTFGEARHWKKQSARFEQLYRADEVSFKKIAAKALQLKTRIDGLSASINHTLKEKNDAENARISAATNALRLRGPGKAACPGFIRPARLPGGAVAPAAANAAVDPVPDRTGVRLIGLPFDDTLAFAAEFDRLRAEVEATRAQHSALEKVWPKPAPETGDKGP